MPFNTIPTTIATSLWKHQREALDKAIGHLNSGSTSPFLIRMPTGTGKSGIIACLTGIAAQGSALVVTPWAHLRDQMINDISQLFWEKIKVSPPKFKVKGILPGNISDVLDSDDKIIMVSTFAAINQIRRNRTKDYERLAERVELILADEGHYEPALEWGKSVRRLKKPTILLTATPYRNDLKLFRIENPETCTFHFTHAEAESNKIIRPVNFKGFNSLDFDALCNDFVTAWNHVRKGLPSGSPRAIVCCDDDESIIIAAEIFRKAGISAIGIHEQFKSRPEVYLKYSVPRPADEPAEVWIHQHKLVEGLDDHRFSCLAILGPIRSDRKLIQQIGRILRSDSNDSDSPALVLYKLNYNIHERWQRYRDFEQKLELLDPYHFIRIVNEMVQKQPEVEYFAGRFRRRFNPALPEIPALLIPPSVLVRRCSSEFSLDEYVEDCMDTLNLEDAVNLGPKLNSPLVKAEDHALWVYATINNSRILLETSLYEVRLETHCVVRVKDLVFIADSAGFLPYQFLEDSTKKLASGTLGRFVDERFRPTYVSVSSVMPYDTVIRSAEISGQNLMNVAASLTDRVHICRSIRGSSRTEGRRTANLLRGRLRKEIGAEERRQFGLDQFRSWAIDVASILNSDVKRNSLLERYMHTCDPPASIIPSTICIDFERENVDIVIEDGANVWLKNESGDVIPNTNGGYECNLIIEHDDPIKPDELLSLGISYDSHRQKFRFVIKEGPPIIVTWNHEDGIKSRSLPEYLEQQQDLVLIGLEDGNIVYQGGDFFEIDYGYAERALIDCIKTVPGIPACSSEKGTKAEIDLLKTNNSPDFPSGSLFGAILSYPALLPFDAEIIICDDLATECADFVAVNFSKKQFALIHAKAGDGSSKSASSFHEVVAQAMKNMVYFTRSNDRPQGIQTWNSRSRWNNTSIPRLLKSKNGMPKTGENIWRKIKSGIIESSSPDLHVVLLTTGCCEAAALKAAVKHRNKRTPQVAQLLHLLDGLTGHARQLGVKLTVYDIPFIAV